jgi:hypothetical protein
MRTEIRDGLRFLKDDIPFNISKDIEVLFKEYNLKKVFEEDKYTTITKTNQQIVITVNRVLSGFSNIIVPNFNIIQDRYLFYEKEGKWHMAINQTTLILGDDRIMVSTLMEAIRILWGKY